MTANSRDDELLQRAIALARASEGLASPNPYVGAVIADDRAEVVGSGTFTFAGVKHAEILALEAAGERSRGGTLYINLEPHAHHGRTPPCTDALIRAGIRRVVACMADPNPKVSERGFAQLRAAGIQVEVGKLHSEAKKLNEAFARYIRNGVPLVTLKSAMSLDGNIAPSLEMRAQTRDKNAFSGSWITGEQARAHAHELRHQQDAILVGVGTILADNPLLTDRSARPRRRPLLRVILDSKLRLPINSRIVQNTAAERRNDLLIFCTAAEPGKKLNLEQLGVRVEEVSGDANGRPKISSVLRRLAELEITSLMVEGGATVNGAVLRDGAADKIFFYYAPNILGGLNPVPFALTDAPGASLRVQDMTLHRFGEDFAIEGYFRDPYT